MSLPPLPEQQQIVTYLDQKTSQIDELIDKKTRKIELLKEYRTSLINQVVTKGLDPNVEMKDSGVEWIGEIPDHWLVKKLPYVTDQMGSGTTPKSDNREYYEDGTIPWLVTGDLNDGELSTINNKITDRAIQDYSALRIFPEGSLSIAMYGATIGKLGLFLFPMTVNQANCVLVFTNNNIPKFWFYILLGHRQMIISFGTGGGQPNVSQDILRTLRFPCPDKYEQQQIVTYLDQKTKEIDTSIETEEKKIEHFKEYRQSLISNVVTGKIDVRETVLS